jgi:hypothetical protein
VLAVFAKVNNWLQPVAAINRGVKCPLVFEDKKLCLETLVLKRNLYARLGSHSSNDEGHCLLANYLV